RHRRVDAGGRLVGFGGVRGIRQYTGGRMGRQKLFGDLVERVLCARGQDDVVTLGDEALSGCLADAARGAGDDHGASHGSDRSSRGGGHGVRKSRAQSRHLCARVLLDSLLPWRACVESWGTQDRARPSVSCWTGCAAWNTAAMTQPGWPSSTATC